MERIIIGEIINTQGVKGEVRVFPITDFPERFFEEEEFKVIKGEDFKVLKVERVREHKQFIVIKFKGVDSMNDAESLKGYSIIINRDELKELPEGRYYIMDILGLKVITTEGEEIGEVKDVLKTGANDVYVVKRPAGVDVLIPVIDPVVKEVNLEKGQIVIELMEGLI